MVELQSSKLSVWVRIPLPLYVLFMRLLGNFISFLVRLFYQNKTIIDLLFLVINWLLLVLKISKKNNKNKVINWINWEQNTIYGGFFWIFLDNLFLLFFSKNFNFIKNSKIKHIINDKSKQFNNDIYKFNNSVNYHQSYLSGFKSMWVHLRYWIIPIIVLYLFVYYTFFLKSLPFSKIIFGYLLLGNMFYLLFSGFVFFLKKYQYRLYTSVIQRFWRRTLFIFWAIEGSLFTVFVYLIFNSSQEPVYVYDNIQIYKSHLYSWRYFLIKIILSTLLIILTYIFLISIKWNTFSKTNNLALFITIILLYTAWLEFYQLFHLMNCYGSSTWVYDFSEHLWNLELEFKRTRIVNHYVTIGLVAKFWHIVFAVIFWLFFLLRGLESTRYRYSLLSANLQNFLIIYIMSWLYMYPWFKFIARKNLDMPYFWFFINNRKLSIFIFFNDIKLYWWGFIDYYFNLNFLKKKPFIYWHESSFELGSTHFRKNNIRDFFVNKIIS